MALRDEIRATVKWTTRQITSGQRDDPRVAHSDEDIWEETTQAEEEGSTGNVAAVDPRSVKEPIRCPGVHCHLHERSFQHSEGHRSEIVGDADRNLVVQWNRYGP